MEPTSGVSQEEKNKLCANGAATKVQVHLEGADSGKLGEVGETEEGKVSLSKSNLKCLLFRTLLKF